MTKRGIIDELIKRRPSFPARDAESIVNLMFSGMAEGLERGERIEIRGFGSFGVKHRKARVGRNPRTGQTVEVEAKRIPFFRAGKDLRVEVNGPPKDEGESSA
jgi:integration host factor subunit beta